MLTRKQVKLIRERVARIEPLLAGIGSELQGAVLCDLTATWLAGHQGEGADKLRKELLKLHVECVLALIPINEREHAEREMMVQIEEGKLQ